MSNFNGDGTAWMNQFNQMYWPEDEKFYKLNEEELAFFRQKTGIQDAQELKAHITAIRAEAYQIETYPCIRRYAFAKLKIARMPLYPQLLKIGKERSEALFLDLGTCFGNDIRKPIFDGFPAERALGVDIRTDFWELGYKLFKDSPETFKVPLIRGDVFDPAFLEDLPILTQPPSGPHPPLSALTSLNPLHGRISVIHAASFFHLFSEQNQLALAHKLAGLLSPEPGSFLFGSHIGQPEEGIRVDHPGGASSSGPLKMFCHSPNAWKELWEKRIFREGQVQVQAFLEEVDREGVKKEDENPIHMMIWSVTRL